MLSETYTPHQMLIRFSVPTIQIVPTLVTNTHPGVLNQSYTSGNVWTACGCSGKIKVWEQGIMIWK